MGTQNHGYSRCLIKKLWVFKIVGMQRSKYEKLFYNMRVLKNVWVIKFGGHQEWWVLKICGFSKCAGTYSNLLDPHLCAPTSGFLSITCIS